MNAFVENGILRQMDCDPNFAYVLTDSTAFLPTEYKVLQNCASDCLVRCMKMLYNGKTQLYYMVDSYKPLSSLLSSLDPARFVALAANLLSCILEVKNNGFLTCRKVELSFDRIFVDPSTNAVHLVYLPVKPYLFDDQTAFEKALQASLSHSISAHDNLSCPQTVQLSSDLLRGSFTLETLYENLKDMVITPPVKEEPPAGKISYVRLIARNAPIPITIDVAKDEFSLGKKFGEVDRVLSFNNKISRVHCKINRSGDQCTITDLHSSNGTYVNRVRLQPDQPAPLKNGDTVWLANSEFQVEIG